MIHAKKRALFTDLIFFIQYIGIYVYFDYLSFKKLYIPYCYIWGIALRIGILIKLFLIETVRTILIQRKQTELIQILEYMAKLIIHFLNIRFGERTI